MKSVGILQLNPHTFWHRGGGEVHAAKYLQLLNQSGYHAEWFDLKNPKRYDILHFFGANIQLAEWGKYAQKEGIKVVGTPILFPSQSTLKYRAFLAFDRFLPFPTTLRLRKQILDDSDALIANTEAEKRYLVSAYSTDESKITVLGTGINQSLLNWQGSKQHLPEEIKNWGAYFLMIGRVTPLKNQLKAMQLLAGKPYKLVICGEPDAYETNYVKQIESICAAYPQQFFWIKGLHPDSEELKALYAFSSAHLLFSETDVAPLVNMEAAGLGTLVMSRAHITVKEILGHHAFYVDESNLIEILDKIQKMSENERKQRLENARNHVAKNFTWEHIVHQSALIYTKLLNT
jgi:glycosyltransferase involved in cell wall biosynthesis